MDQRWHVGQTSVSGFGFGKRASVPAVPCNQERISLASRSKSFNRSSIGFSGEATTFLRSSECILFPGMNKRFVEEMLPSPFVGVLPMTWNAHIHFIACWDE